MYFNSYFASDNPKVFCRRPEAAALPEKAIAPSTEVSPPHAPPLHSEAEPAPTTADISKEAAPSGEIDVGADTADAVGTIRTALSSDPQDVEGAAATVSEIIKAVRKTVGISNNVIQLDNGKFHQSSSLKIPDNIFQIFQPPYSPELNPIERIRPHVKQELSWKISKNLEELKEKVCVFLGEFSTKKIAPPVLSNYILSVSAAVA